MENSKAYWIDKHGQPILKEGDGFLVQGNIYVASPYKGDEPSLGGLVGCGRYEDMAFSQIPFEAFSKEELLRVLKYTPEELMEIARSIRREENPQPSPISLGKDGWYFSDETWTAEYGPYRTKYEAQSKLKEYCDNLNGKGIKEVSNGS
ncbi:hypothetical protein LCGC14_1002600 [marine sediment metagenome]|uniref:Uncharacterized protein n=1 Tax=marine sediment metagenome TaxID=412755 RepID=A0A0F9NP24_9ZZZZ